MDTFLSFSYHLLIISNIYNLFYRLALKPPIKVSLFPIFYSLFNSQVQKVSRNLKALSFSVRSIYKIAIITRGNRAHLLFIISIPQLTWSLVGLEKLKVFFPQTSHSHSSSSTFLRLFFGLLPLLQLARLFDFATCNSNTRPHTPTRATWRQVFIVLSFSSSC